MKNDRVFLVASIIALCLSMVDTSLTSGGSDRAVLIASLPTKAVTAGSSCSVKSSKKKTSTSPFKQVRNIRATFFTDLNLHNKEAFDLLNQLWHSKSGWQYVNTKDGVSVERRNLPAGTFVDATDAAKGSKHACVRSSGMIKATPQSVIDLFLDNSRVSEFNEHVIEVKDIQCLPRKKGDDSWTKLSWAAGPKYGPFKARDFASVVNYKKFQNGTFMIINRPAYHPEYPPTSKYVRATTLLVGNIIEPVNVGDNQLHTRLTQVAHVNPGGAADTSAAAYLINKLCAVGPPSFIRKLEAAAVKSDNMKNDKNNRKDKNFQISSLKNDMNNLKSQWSQLDGKITAKKKSLIVAFTNSRNNLFK